MATLTFTKHLLHRRSIHTKKNNCLHCSIHADTIPLTLQHPHRQKCCLHCSDFFTQQHQLTNRLLTLQPSDWAYWGSLQCSIYADATVLTQQHSHWQNTFCIHIKKKTCMCTGTSTLKKKKCSKCSIHADTTTFTLQDPHRQHCLHCSIHIDKITDYAATSTHNLYIATFMLTQHCLPCSMMMLKVCFSSVDAGY